MDKNKEKKPPFIITAPKEYCNSQIRVISSAYVHINEYEYKPRVNVDGNQIVQKLNPPPGKPNVKAGYTEVLVRKLPYQTDPYERQECIERYEALQNQVKVKMPFKCPLRHKVQLKQQTQEAIHSYGKKVVINNLSKLQKSAKSKQQTEKIQVLIQKASTLFTTRKVELQQHKENLYGFDKQLFHRIDEWKSKLQCITQKKAEEQEQIKVSFHKHRMVIKNQQIKSKNEQQLKNQSKSFEKDLSIQVQNSFARPKTATQNNYKPVTPSNFNKNIPPPIQIQQDDISIIKSEVEKKPRINQSNTPKSNQSKNIAQSPKQQQLVKQSSLKSIKQQKQNQDGLSKDKSFSNKDSNYRKRQVTEEERKTNQYTEERKSQGRDGQSNRSEERKSNYIEEKKQKSKAKFIKPRINRMQSAKNNQSNEQKDPQQKKTRPSSAGGKISTENTINLKEYKLMSQQSTSAVNKVNETNQQQTTQNESQSIKTLEIAESIVTVIEPKKSRFRQGSKQQASSVQPESSIQVQNEQLPGQQEAQGSDISQVNMGLVNVNAPLEQHLGSIEKQQTQCENNQDQIEKDRQLRVSQMASTNSLLYKQELNSLKDSLISESLLVSQIKDSSVKDNQFTQSQFKESQLIQSQLNDQESINLSESQVTIQPVVKKRRFVSRQE